MYQPRVFKDIENRFPDIGIRLMSENYSLQFGAAVLCSLLQQGEKVYCNTSPVDMDNQLQTEWLVS